MTGYSKLACFMAEENHPVLRKYQHVAVRDLLYLQAEICHLESRYALISKSNRGQKDKRQYYDRNWELLADPKERGFEGEQKAVAMELRFKIREYYDAMLQYSRIASLPRPKDTERSALLEWTRNPKMGGVCDFQGRDLSGFDQPSVYEATYQKNLVILANNHGEGDLFTKFANGPLLSAFHWIRACFGVTRVYLFPQSNYHAWLIQLHLQALPIDPENPPVGDNKSILHHYDHDKVETVTNLLGTVLSSLAPLISIVALSFVTGSRARLGLICAFTLLFSLCLATATKARRVEIFAATAA
ncbi:hypothetical protein B0O99DRAFT_675419 [Bisporella sp. PMI_857]|nr:hypothetical protein B0O99DRAFT_675419 [Bisporella sp. PMI_857]